ncbi:MULTISPECIES: GH1 family beta-glucosidase [unclassified Microbacterium]|uniref:GH1 family beta-glucosidase n=1 Tax=unclassified Microbacterium TaxID=2609290 RepID=UPI0012F98E61|nr:GH1 family beta-glucosidase [Microbacterium sp. MAH-37]MVQ41596.1 beta-glucosidase [Microbacterium sp. MAH-37]
MHDLRLARAQRSADYRDQNVAFPASFVFGAATAAYQIEGAAAEDGRGASIWDVYSHQPGRILNGDTGDVAADHYHRLDEDLDLLSALDIPAYRFSTSWSRIFPDGRGPVNAAGVDFYDRLVDGLLARGIAPYLTLYHWDLPQALQEQGGWRNRETAERFAEYAGFMGRHFGDRVRQWTTLNEPWCAAYLGHASGVMAPGITEPLAALEALHHLNLAHGRAAQELRSAIAPGGEVSVTLNFQCARASGPTGGEAVERIDLMSNRSFADPILLGQYPERLFDITSHVTDWGFIEDGDLVTIHQPLDFLGVNYYSTLSVRMWDGHSPRLGEDGHKPGASPWVGAEDVEFLPQAGPYTQMGWNIAPDGLDELLRTLSTRYPGTPLAITENGAARDDRVINGCVEDPERVDYLHRHLAAVNRCIEDGVDIRGYFAWSLLDNFEWAHGYERRFGLVHVDYETLVRTPKRSAYWYSELCRTAALPPVEGTSGA